MKFTVGPIRREVFAEAYRALSATEESRRHPWSRLDRPREVDGALFVDGLIPEDDEHYTLAQRQATLAARLGSLVYCCYAD